MEANRACYRENCYAAFEFVWKAAGSRERRRKIDHRIRKMEEMKEPSLVCEDRGGFLAPLSLNKPWHETYVLLV